MTIEISYWKDFTTNNYCNCHNLMVLEGGRDIIWLMIGGDNWKLQARLSIMSKPSRKHATKSTITLKCTVLYHSNASLKVLYKTVQWLQEIEHEASNWKLNRGKKWSLWIWLDRTEYLWAFWFGWKDVK